MGKSIALVGALALGLSCLAAEPAAKDDPATEIKPLLRSIVQSLLDERQPPSFEMASRLFAIDNGEVMSREDLQKAWTEFRKVAFKKKVSLDEFFNQVDVQVSPAADNKRMRSNPRVMAAWKPEKGDLYCDMSKVKAGVESFIGYDKAFLYVLRKVDGQWTVIGIGG